MIRTLCFLIVFGINAFGQAEKTVIRIGTYDSRAVALAFYNSEPQMKYLTGLRTEYEKAKAAGDEKRAKELEAEGPARQEFMHWQVFSAGSIGNITTTIKDKLPAIAQEAGVQLLVSKWEVVYQEGSVEFVDVTMPLVKLFHPSEKVLKMVEEMKTVEPVPFDQLLGHREKSN